MNFALKLMNFALKLMNFALKMTYFVFKMMNFTADGTLEMSHVDMVSLV